MAAHNGVAARTAKVSRIGRPSKFPAQTATVCSLSNPTVHASRKPLLVPVFAATRFSKASGEFNPKLFCLASLSHKISVMIAVASSDASFLRLRKLRVQLRNIAARGAQRTRCVQDYKTEYSYSGRDVSS